MKLPFLGLFSLCWATAASAQLAPPSTMDEDKITVCPVITPELHRKIIIEGGNAGGCKAGCQGCGCKGGPGYRGPDRKCVGYANILEVCGPAPHSGCVRECQIVSPGCQGRAWLKALGATIGITVGFVASQRFKPDGTPLPGEGGDQPTGQADSPRR